ncbi:MAG: putative DNA-binding domain-containing protein, partial [Betaproteobacteria bacterium]|nr:putative DNA-binding domain-containing protein [Betaproteobacteria bacterium]
MPPFADTLGDFARALRRPDGAWPGAAVRATHYPADEALDIYRNNWRHNLRGALAGAYPVLVQVVGEAFFRQLALRFMEENPSTSGNLHDYGAALPAFLARFAPAQSLPYLPDLAALEWACHCAYFAEEDSPLELLHSPYPVAAIWRAHQPGAPEDFRIDLGDGPCRVLVYRSEGEA